ncbi:MAG: phosphotransferase [Novosphingobium sp.]|nr:phosphotransferase [Novosphingobium sp.]
MTFSPAPLDADLVVTPDWLSHALSQGRDPVTVDSVDVVETLGPSALKIRMKLTYDRPRPDLPDAICLKGIFAPSLRQWLDGGAQQTESLFYRDVAPGLSVRVPKCFYAGLDTDTKNGIIIMEDLVPQGATFMSAMSPYTPQQVRGSLEQLAALHAGTWNLADEKWPWVTSKMAGFTSGAISADRITELMAGERGELLTPAIRTGEMIFAGIAALAEREKGLEKVFVHGDSHGGNVYETADGEIGLIDWQVLTRGHWSVDVAYHMAAALDIEDRRASEADLLDHYLDRLAAHGGKPPAREEAWQLYRESFPYGLLMWGMTQRVEPQIVNRFVGRLGTAAMDHDSFGLLGCA